MASTFFEGCVVALSGTLSATHEKLSLDITGHGGKVTRSVTPKTTHLVPSQKDFDKNAPKVQQAAAYKEIKIVNTEWILACVYKQVRLPETSYFMAQGTGQSSKKRADGAHPNDIDKPSTKKRKIVPPKELQVAADEFCRLPGFENVYIDEAGVIYDAALNQSNSAANNNKFYQIQILHNHSSGEYMTWTRWGRIGESGQGAILGDGQLVNAIFQFKKKFRDKTGLPWEQRLEMPKKNKYNFVEKNYQDSSDDERTDAPNPRSSQIDRQISTDTAHEPQSTLPEAVQRLMKLIFNQSYFEATMHEMQYDSNKLPLGKLSERTLMKGFETLKQLGELIVDPSTASSRHCCTFREAIEDLTNQFYTTIPHAFGRRKPPLIGTEQRLKQEISLLESLTDMEIANQILKDTKDGTKDGIHLLDRQFVGLGLDEMTPLKPVSKEFREIQSYLTGSKGHTHDLNFKIEDIFRISRKGESSRFVSCSTLQGSDRRLLWHGSRCTNFGGILNQGLRIAPSEAPATGYMFGKGVYLADVSTKSANYCHPHLSENTALLLLCEAELGRPLLELTDADYNAAESAKETGRLATLGKGITSPTAWKDAAAVHKDLRGVRMPDMSQPLVGNALGVFNNTLCLQYNEYIVYDIAQIRLRYLLRVHVD